MPELPTGTATATQERPESPTTQPTAVTGNATATLMPLADRQELFDEVWTTVEQNYLYADYNGADWGAIYSEYEPRVQDAQTSTEFYTALSEMVQELNDDHSRFLSPEERQEEDDLQSGNANYVGVGIIQSPNADSLTVVFVFPNSPAERAGLQRRDRIMAVDGVPLVNPGDSPSKIRGPEGSTVVLTVRSPGQAERDVAIVRDRITGGVVASSHRLANDPGIGILIVPNLSTETMGKQVAEQLNTMLEDTPDLKGIVMDLRANGGGFRFVLQEILSYFVSGSVGSFVDASGSYPLRITADPLKEDLDDIPLVILVDSGTESYAEVLAAGIQEMGRAQVVGVQSAGNTETIFQYNFDDGSRLWCAEEGYELPGGTNMEGIGVQPDYVIDDDWTAYSEESDPHILKAIELITKGP